MKVKEAMSTDPETISPTATIKKAAKKMNIFRIGSLIVITPGFEIVGIITERDILKAFVKGKGPETKVKDIMTKDVVTIEQNAPLEEAADKMLKYGIKRLAVVKKGQCIGIITTTDLITYEARLTDKLMELMQTPKKLVQGG